MIITKTNLIVFLVGAFLGLATGFFSTKAYYDRPIEESVKSDTVWVTDTLPDYTPSPKDSVKIKWLTRWLPKTVHDTVDNLVEITEWLRDTVEVQVPITSKHYGNETYDAWVSGFEPSLDSIKVYQKTEIITNTITKERHRSPLSLDVRAGADYFTEKKELYPFVKGNLEYNISKSRFSIGADGGVYKVDKAQPFVGGYVKFRIL